MKSQVFAPAKSAAVHFWRSASVFLGQSFTSIQHRKLLKENSTAPKRNMGNGGVKFWWLVTAMF